MNIITAIVAVFVIATFGCGKPLSPTYGGYQNLRLEKVGFKGNVVAAEVKLFNPNNYPLQMKSADLDLYFNDHFVGKTKFDTLINLLPKDTAYIPLRLTASAKDLLLNAGRVLLNPNVKIRIEGKVKAGRKGFFVNVPVNYEGVQRINILRDTVNDKRPM